MSQSSSYGPTSTNTILGGDGGIHSEHISQTQSNEMMTYNSNNISGNNNMVVDEETTRNSNSFVVTNNTSVVNQQQPSITGTIPKEGKTSKSAKQQQPRKPPPTIDSFWPTILQEVQSTAISDSKHQSLPLARIKKIMKLDENAKMIAAEAPLLFAKACEFFIQELTMRAWIHTDESKRRTLQRSDIAQAIANYDQFDFLIDIVPREDIKPPSHRRHHNDSNTSNNPTTTASSSSTTIPTNVVTGEILNVTALPMDSMNTTSAVTTAQPTAANISRALTQHQQQQPTQVLTTTSHPTQQLQIIQQTAQPQQHLQYFITLPSQQTGQAQLVHQLQLQQQQQQQLNNALSTPLTAASLNLVAQQPHQLILTAANTTGAQAANVAQQQQQATLLQNLAQHHHQQQQHQQQQQQHHPQQQQQVQLLQHVVLTPNGELANMPIAINANQLQLLRLQMQQQQQQQQQQQHIGQQVIIPTHLLTAQQLLQLQAVQQQQQQHQQHHNQHNNNTATTTHIVHHQPTQQQQTNQQHSQAQTNANNIYINSNPSAANQAAGAASMVSTDRNLGSTFRNNC